MLACNAQFILFTIFHFINNSKSDLFLKKRQHEMRVEQKN